MDPESKVHALMVTEQSKLIVLYIYRLSDVELIYVRFVDFVQAIENRSKSTTS